MEHLLTFLLVLAFIAGFLSGAPLFTLIGAAGVVCFSLIAHGSITSVIVEMCRLANAPGITAIPMFIFAGYVLAESNCSSRIIKISNSVLGWAPGGLAIVCAVGSSVFTAMTGASGVTIIAVGGILLPALLKDGYSKSFSLGLVTAAGSSGVLLVPSLPIIIYGMISQVDIKQLFIACALPMVLIVICLGIAGVIHGIRHKIPTQAFNWKTLYQSTREGIWEIPLPFLVVGGIYGGIITVSEAAVATAVYVIVTECIIYREISIRHLFRIMVDSIITTGSILVVLGTALGLTNFLVDQSVPQTLLEQAQIIIHSKITFLLLFNVVMLFLGSIMEIYSAIVVMVPLVAPVAAGYGIDPVHLGVMFLANLELGYLTPPFGVNLFLSSLRFDISVVKLYRYVLPFLAILCGALLLITYWEGLSLWLIKVTGAARPILHI